jgi:hypothetical protein
VYPQGPPPHQPQYPAQYPAAQYPAPQYPPPQSYPPYPVGAQQHPGYPAPAHPGYGYQQAPYQQPHKRTEFGWASIIVGSIALMTSLLPYGGFITGLAAVVLVLAGWLGKHERSRTPAAVGTAITALALVSSVIITLFWRDIYGGLLGL